jgi:RimJ/RimL family protein N-acetyltransferase
MKITRYGVALERLEEDRIDLLRTWRNDDKIAKFMFHQGAITPLMQRDWFLSIDNEQNYFFIINYRNQPAGLINISSVDWDNRTAYTGLFIYDEKLLATDVPVMASLAMLDVFFILFDIQVAYAKVKGTNKVAHNYNSALGFVRTKKIEMGLGYEYMLQKEIYLLQSVQLRNAAIRLKGNSTAIQLNRKNKTDCWIEKRLLACKTEAMLALETHIQIL